MPPASFRQSRSGWPISSMSKAFLPGFFAPTFINSPLSISYVRLANITLTTSHVSRAWVQRACSVYIPLPSPSRQITLRSGQAIAAPVAKGMPIPMEPPVTDIQSCCSVPAVKDISPRPDVMDSSTIMAFFGIRRPIAAAMLSGVSSPLISVGFSAFWRTGSTSTASSSSAIAVRASSRS